MLKTWVFLLLLFLPHPIPAAKVGFLIISSNLHHLNSNQQKIKNTYEAIAIIQKILSLHCNHCLFVFAFQEVEAPLLFRHEDNKKFFWQQKSKTAFLIDSLSFAPFQIQRPRAFELGENIRAMQTLTLKTPWVTLSLGNVHWPSQFHPFKKRRKASEGTWAWLQSKEKKVEKMVLGDFNLKEEERRVIDHLYLKPLMAPTQASYFYPRKKSWHHFDLFWGIKERPQTLALREFSHLYFFKNKYFWVPKAFKKGAQRGYSDHYPIYQFIAVVEE